MKIIKSFESWNNNIIDNSLFKSGKAKYDARVVNGTIKYQTGTTPPYYFAEISSKGDKFICKIYKKKKDGDEIRLRNKLKKELKLAHNYVREFINQKLKKDKLKKSKRKDRKEDIERIIKEEPRIQREPDFIPQEPVAPPQPARRTIIRRF
jgi:hypothetical protein